MSSLPPSTSAPVPAPANSNRGLLIGGVIALLIVCLCIMVIAAIAGGLFITGRIGPTAQGAETPGAALIMTPTPVQFPITSATPLESNSPTPFESHTATSSATPSPTPTASRTPTAANSPTATATPTASVPPASPSTWSDWPVVFSESFTSNTNGWNISDQQPASSDFGKIIETLGNGKLRLEANMVKGANIKYWPKNPQSAGVFAVSADGLRVSGTDTDYGIVIRRDASGNCYVFLIRDLEKTYAVYMFSGQWVNLTDWTSSDAIRPGKVNNLAAMVEGSHFTFFINGQQVGTLDNTQVSGGLDGVTFDTAANSQAVFEFSNFKVQVPAGTAQATPTGQSALATPSSAGEWPIVFSDKFNTNSNGWNVSDQQPYTSDYGTFGEKLAGGHLTIDAKTVKGVNEKYWPKTLKNLTDLSVTVDAQRMSGPLDAGYGLVFRRDANNNFYLFEIRDTKQYSVWVYQGQWSTLVDWTNVDSIQPGLVNSLNATAQGPHLTFSINGQQVGALDNSQVGNGTAGVALDLDANLQAVFQFSNFVVRAPSTAGLATPAPPTQWRVVLTDKFDSNSNGWNIAAVQPNKDDYGTYRETIAGGKLTIDAQVVKGTNQKRWPNVAAVTDFSVSVDARQVSGPTGPVYGIMFRRDSNGSAYIFEVGEDKQYSLWLFKGQWTNLIPSTKTDAIRPGQVNHLNVVGIGSHFTFSINDQQVGSIDNGQIPGGLVGLVFEMDPGAAVFEFSNFELDTP